MKTLLLITPLVLTLAPILFVWSQNEEQVEFEVVPPIIGVCLSGAFILLLLSLAILRNRVKAAAAASVVVLLFFAYGHLFELVWDAEMFKSMTALYWAISIVFALIAGAAMFAIYKFDDVTPFVRFLLIAGVILTVISAFSIGRNLLTRDSGDSFDNISAVVTPIKDFGTRPEPLAEETTQSPDIYYIVLDGYTRQDILSEYYAYDNEPFLEELRKRGFYVAQSSTSNYAMTFQSLGSVLNLRYINEDIERLRDKTSPTRTELYGLIHDNEAARFLQSKGYRYISVNTNYSATEKSDIADIEFQMAPRWARSEFTSVMMRTTASRALIPSVADGHRFAFDAVERSAQVQGPAFTFCHMLVPHNPYVFDAEGNEQTNVPLHLQWTEKTGGWVSKEAYIRQLRFVNKRTLEMIDRILASSKVRPVIVIQADHGSASEKAGHEFSPDEPNGEKFIRERHSILNAMLVPESVRRNLYPTISSVNTFRVIFSHLFAADYPLLEDRNYCAWYSKPYVLFDVTDTVQKYEVKDNNEPENGEGVNEDSKKPVDRIPVEQSPVEQSTANTDQKAKISK